MEGQESQQARTARQGAGSGRPDASRLRAELAAGTGCAAATKNPGGRIERIGVVVPANIEQCALPVCLAGLRAAASRVLVPVTVVVVLDSCTDYSA